MGHPPSVWARVTGLWLQWPTGTVADLGDINHFRVFADGIENSVDVRFVAVEQVAQMGTFW